MKVNKQSIKVISMILIILMAFLLPVQVCAEVIGEKEEEITADFSNVSSDVDEIGDIVSEIIDERTENSKTFLLSDGTKMLAEYPEPVHFKNENGNWTEYNNSLVKKGENATSDEAKKDGEFTNKKSDTDITLSSSADSDNLIMFSDDKYTISWGYKNADDSDIKVINHEDQLSGNDKYTNLDNISSEAEYEEVFDNVDLQYELSSTKIKENIILNDPDARNEFEIAYDIGALTPNQVDDNTIILYDGKKKVYKIDAPFMFDSKGVSSSKLKFEIIKNNNGILNVKLIADKDFIYNDERSFPITIDPEIDYEMRSGGFSYTGFIGNNVTNNPPYYLSSYAYNNWKITTLPSLDGSEVITKATVKYDVSSISGSVSQSNPIVVNLHKGKSSSPYYQTDVEDYCAISSSNDDLEFDITKLMKSWLSGSSNDGFVLKASSSIGSRQLSISPASSINAYPMYTIIYKDFSGKEDNHSYHTVSAGSKAEVSVNDYLGSLIVSQNLYESKAERMPVSLSATYNSFDYNTDYSDSMIGYGWKFSFNQYIKETNSTLQNAGYDYVYIDEDKSKHYLKENPDNLDEWQDEESLGLTLTVGEDDYYYLDDGSRTKKFKSSSSGGNLVYESENEITSNHIGYGRSSDGTISNIYDSTNTTVASFSTMTINNRKYVSKISLLNSATVDFSYTQLGSKVLLSKVKQTDGTCSLYTYDNQGKLTQVRFSNESSSTIKYGGAVSVTYNSKNQISCITEKGTDSSTGNYLNFTYGNDNTTSVTDRKNRTEKYTFDNEGNKISTLNANGFISNGGGSGLSISGGSDSFTKNYITESSSFSGVGSGYYFNKANNSMTSGIARRTKYFGSSSLSVTGSTISSYSGVEHEFDESELVGETITFSAYVKTDIDNVANTTSSGAYIEIKALNEDHSFNILSSSVYINTTEEWQRISTTLSVPSTAKYVVIFCNMKNAKGTAYFDCLQLEKGTTANDYNALQDCDFNTNNNWKNENNSLVSVSEGKATITGVPSYVNVTEETEEVDTDEEDSSDISTTQETTVVTEHDIQDTTDAYGNVIQSAEGEYQRVYYVENYSDDEEEENVDDGSDTEIDSDSESYSDNKYIYHTVNVRAADVSFNLSGEAEAKSVPITNEARTFGIALNIYYKDSNVPEKHYKEFNSLSTSRQTVSFEVTPYDTDTIIDHVAFSFVYGYNSNEMTVYNAMLNISVNKANVLNADTEEDENSDEIEEFTTVTNTTEPEDDVVLGDLVSETLDTSEPYIKTNTMYNSNGNYVLSETDELGNTTSYTYDANGNKATITDGNNNVVNYSYNASDNVASISNGNAQNSYSYDYLGNISAINHNSFSYLFNYNEYNKLIDTKINDTTIVNNEYYSNDGNIKKTNFANGDYISYEYDNFDNITKISSNTGTIARFIYNKKGLVSRCIDYQGGYITYYYYDYRGELQGQYIQNNNGGLSKYISFDEEGNQIEKTSVSGTYRTITTGTNDEGEEFVDYDGLQSVKKTDDFGRITTINTSINSGSPFITKYGYASGTEANSTSKTINKYENRYQGDCYAVYNYTYDRAGNITEVKENGNTIYRYTYDSLNQLKEEFDYVTHRYTEYTYDNSGNITFALKSSLSSTGTIGGVCGSKNYTFGDTDWKDKLTKYGNTTITYDAIGNPLSYRNGMSFTWKNGRWLATTTLSDNTSVTYQYNYTGIRTKKTVGGVSTNYYYDSNNNLIGLKSGSDVAYFYYDTENSLVSMKYNNNIYYYVKNLQGDIVKILNSNGSTLASYTYDAWGNITRTTVSDSTVANMSPFRYRGYVYDTDTGLYYLQSRYYDPQTGRFINADDTAYIGATGTVLSGNLFAYCENDAVNYIDKTGKSFFTVVKGIFIAAAWTYRLSIMMYAYSATGAHFWSNINLSDRWNPIGQALKSRLKSSKKISDRVKSYIRKTSSRNKTYSKTESIGFSHSSKTTADLDLAYSVGHASNCYIKVIRTDDIQWFTNKRRYIVIITLSDLYDFDYFGKKEKNYIKRCINNYFGYYPQKYGLLKKYNWKISFSYNYYK